MLPSKSLHACGACMHGLLSPKVGHFAVNFKALNVTIFLNYTFGVTVLSQNSADLSCGRRPTHGDAALAKSTVTLHRPDG